MADMRDIVNAMLDDARGTSMADVCAAENRLRNMFTPHQTTDEYRIHIDMRYTSVGRGTERLVRMVEMYDRTQPFGERA